MCRLHTHCPVLPIQLVVRLHSHQLSLLSHRRRIQLSRVQAHFWFGSDKLWTDLRADGTWQGLPHYTPESTSFRQKLFWWRQGYDWLAEPNPFLKVTGRRLDAPAQALASSQANGSYRHEDWESFMVVGIDIPTYGCWQITGRYGDDELTYVVIVAP